MSNTLLTPYEVEFEEVVDPTEKARRLARRARFESNWDWLEAHAGEVYSHRDKFICIAGRELFVGDTLEEVVASARAAHPEEDAAVTRYIPKTPALRIYAF
jgi:hypothetical protein